MNVKKLRQLAAEHPEMADRIAAIIEAASLDGKVDYPNEIDHGYGQPLSGGWDIMKRLQDQLLIEQGSKPRDPNPRLASDLQRHLIRVMQGGTAREMVRQAVVKHASETDTVVMVNAAVDEIINNAIGVALSPTHLAAVLSKHTVKEK